MLAPEEYRARLAVDAPAFADAVATAPDAMVTGCPGWTTSDLALHLGGVHRWATAILQTGGPQPEIDGEGDPLTWYAGGWPALLETLDTTDPDAACWGLGAPPRLASFWWRRQAHETAMHLWDVSTAIGRTVEPDEAFAADGIDEVLTMFAPRMVRLGRSTTPDRAVGFVCPGGRWQLGDGDPAATVRGTGSDLLLLLWKRRPLRGLHVDGDRSAAVAALEQILTP